MKVGIIQGRLSAPNEGFQECPADWKREFSYFEFLDLNHIEWIITEKSFSDNPFFTNSLGEYPIHSVCADNLVNSLIDDFDFVEKNLDPICQSALSNQVPYITIPLLEESSVICDDKRERFIKILKTFVNRYPKLNFSIEAELEPAKLSQILNISEKIYVTYDTGNITSCGFDHEKYIECFFDKISNIHLKDRTINGVTLPPRTGDTDFITIFEKLKELGYAGVFTLQTARETSGREIQTIKQHMRIFKELI